MTAPHMNGRIRRGSIAADRFTQVSNALFRDTRITLKAKGLFGLLSTHRDGYGVTAALIARQCKEGIDAVQSGLRELEKFGYLERERERRADGTRGSVEYFITDAPAEAFEQETRRSEPEPGFPVLDDPGLENPLHKKTRVKNTNDQNTNPSFRPSDRSSNARADEDGRKDGQPAGQTPEPEGRRPQLPKQGHSGNGTVDVTPGVRLLLAFGEHQPGYLLRGKTLKDQGRTVTGLLDAGWTEQQIATALVSPPLPQLEEITTSPGAVIGYRLRELACTPVPGAQPGPAGADKASPPEGPTRAELVTACGDCDEYGFLPTDRPCRHTAVQPAALAAF